MPKTKSFGFFINIAAISAISFGLLAAFGGIDISSLAAFITLMGAFGLSQNQGINNFLRANANIFLLFAAIGVLIIYFTARHFGAGNSINDTIKYLLANIILFPLLVFALKPENKGKMLIARAIFAGFCLGLFALIIEAIDNYAMYKIANPNQAIKAMEVNLGRGAFIIIAFYWPAMLAANALKIDFRIKALAFILTAFLGTRFGIDLNIIIFLMANFVALIALKFPKTIISFLYLIGGIIIAIAPVFYGAIANYAKNFFGSNMPMSYERRADMWLYTIEKIKVQPFWGYGLDSARSFQDKVYLGGYEWTAIQMHPHSAPLHIWLEGGVFGAILLLLVIFIAAYISLQSKLLNKANSWAFCGLLSSVLMVWALSHSIWEQWLWAVSIILFCFIFKIESKQIETSNTLSEL